MEAKKIEKDDFKLVKEGSVRVRFAPSPTGLLHIGGARTALFNYLFAKNKKGRFILRAEDTDEKRSRKEYEENLCKALEWLGIEWDEGPGKDGKYGPYYQSERGEIYKKYLKQMLDRGDVYYCFCSQKDLDTQREYFKSIGKAPVYNGHCRELSKKEVGEKIQIGDSCVIRFKTPAKKIVFEDLVRGKIEFDTALLGDFAIARSLEEPLYNLACAIDDHEMNISHVIRGEEHISNTPKQILIYEAFGWDVPKFAHLPLVLAPDKSKLSKRHGDVSVQDFQKDGYLPEALVNFIAFLGWNPGTKREVYSMVSLIKDFSLERVRKSGSIFNRRRLDYLNGFYIRQKNIKALTKACVPYLLDAGLIQEKDGQYAVQGTGEWLAIESIESMVALYQERLKKLSEIPELIDFFLKKELTYKKELLSWKDQTYEEVQAALDKLIEVLSKVEDSDWREAGLKKTLLGEAERFGLEIRGKGGRGYLLWPLRIALTGKKASAGPFKIAEVMGKEKVIDKINQAKYA